MGIVYKDHKKIDKTLSDVLMFKVNLDKKCAYYSKFSLAWLTILCSKFVN